jgi:hypothetical protein
MDEKYKPIILTLLNSAVSSLASYTSVPLTPIAGLEGISIIIAVMAGGVGSLLGFKDFMYDWVVLLVVSLLSVLALFFYAQLLSRSGISDWQMLLTMFLYWYIFFAIFYLLTHLEKLVLKVIAK